MSMTTHTLTELRGKLGKVVRDALTNPDEEQVITDNGHPVAVIMPVAELRRMRAQLAQAEPLSEAIPHERVMAMMRERLDREGVPYSMTDDGRIVLRDAA